MKWWLKGGERQVDMDFPDEAWYYYQFADRFGWTPDQVDNLPAVHSDWLLAIGNAVEEVKAERAEQASK